MSNFKKLILKEEAEPSNEQWKFLGKIRQNQAESGKYTDAQMERSYKKLMKLNAEQLEELSKLSIAQLKAKGY